MGIVMKICLGVLTADIENVLQYVPVDLTPDIIHIVYERLTFKQQKNGFVLTLWGTLDGIC